MGADAKKKKDRNAIQEIASQHLKLIKSINHNNYESINQLFESLLAEGSKRLSLSLGVISQITGNQYKIKCIYPPSTEINLEQSFCSKDSYCEEVFNQKKIIGIEDINREKFGKKHPVYSEESVAAYIAAPIYVNNQLYGTLNFTCKKVRVDKFKPHEYDLLSMMTMIISNAIERQLKEEEVSSFTKELQAKETLFETLFQSSPDTIVLADENRVILMANKNLFTMFGYHPEEVVGKKTSILYENIKTYNDIGALKFNAKVKNDSAPFEVSYRRKDGTVFMGESVGKALHSKEQAFLAYFVEIRDISVRKVAEQIKDDFISIVSHELRTPLTSIMGALTLMNDVYAEKLDPEVKELVELAEHNSIHLLSLINSMLDLRKLEQGEQVFEFKPITVSNILNDVKDYNYIFAQKFGVNLVIEYSGDEALEIITDIDHITIVFNNLISNAIRYSPHQGIVTIKAEEIDEMVKFSIIDEGPGLEENDREKLFKKFTQVDRPNIRKIGGTGLGLPLCQSILNNLGSQIDYTKNEGRNGTTFYFFLPKIIE